jgi:hypothetical protein
LTKYACFVNFLAQASTALKSVRKLTKKKTNT